jgi:hypothetical protein
MLNIVKASAPGQFLRVMALGHCTYGLFVAYTVKLPASVGTAFAVLHSDVAAIATLCAAVATAVLGGTRRRSWIAIAGVLALVAIARLAVPPAVPYVRWWTLALASMSICSTIASLIRPRESAESTRLRKAMWALGISTFFLMISGFLPPPSLVLGGTLFIVCVLVLGSGDELAKRMRQREWLEEHFGTFEEFLTTLNMEHLHQLREHSGDRTVMRSLYKQYPHLALKLKLHVLNELKTRAANPSSASTTSHGGA